MVPLHGLFLRHDERDAIMTHRLSSQDGITLVEGLLSATILTIGLLGLIGMQTFAMTRNVDANQMTMASNLVSDMVERMTFNNTHVTAYHGIDTDNVATQPPATEPMARGDYLQWRSLIANSGLSHARGTITVTLQDTDPALNPSSIGRRVITVQLTWSGPLHEGISRTHTVTMSTLMSPD